VPCSLQPPVGIGGVGPLARAPSGSMSSIRASSVSSGTAPFLGVAGALIVLQKLRISPSASFSITDWTVLVIFNVVIGGIASFEGPIIGTIVFFVLREYLSDLGAWSLIILGIVSITVILVEPRGLWGMIRRFLPDDVIPTGHKPPSAS
jgi:branched-chain amino acid transport system permease protein